VTTVFLFVSLMALAADSPSSQFSEVRIEKPFDRYLLASPLLMESTGAKVITLPNKRRMIIAVASTPLKDRSPDERLRAEKVCKIKAFAALVQEQKGVHVFPHRESCGQYRRRDQGRQGAECQRFLAFGSDRDPSRGHR